MLKALENLIDPYNLRARLFPAFLVLLPLGCVIAAWVPIEIQALGALGSVAATLGIATLFQQLVRDAGKRVEPELYGRWGGKPSVRMLHYAHSSVNHQTLARCHAKVRESAPELAIPGSIEEEAKHPVEALTAYESASDLLVAKTRGKEKFALLFEENMNYGYRRNIWGLKTWGITTALVGSGVVTVRVVTLWLRTQELAVVPSVAGVVCVVIALFWSLTVNSDWVRRAADVYAHRLVLSADEIDSPKKADGPK